MEAYEKLEEAQKRFDEVKLEAHKQEQMELMRKAERRWRASRCSESRLIGSSGSRSIPSSST